jgi:hypothetical protein
MDGETAENRFPLAFGGSKACGWKLEGGIIVFG